MFFEANFQKEHLLCRSLFKEIFARCYIQNNAYGALLECTLFPCHIWFHALVLFVTELVVVVEVELLMLVLVLPVVELVMVDVVDTLTGGDTTPAMRIPGLVERPHDSLTSSQVPF